jgi:hypothetical protein
LASQILEGQMPEESQVSWKVWVVISIVTAGLTPLIMEGLPSIASAMSRQWYPSPHCVAAVNQPHAPLEIHQAPSPNSGVSVWAQQEKQAQVTVVGERKGWYQVSDPEKGWVKRDQITAACLEKF